MAANWNWNAASQVPPTSSTTTPIPTQASTSSTISSDPLVETFSGLRIKNRLLSIQDMHDNMQDRHMVPISSITTKTEADFEHLDWVVIGVLASKSLTQTTKHGSNYMIWTISNLEGTSINVFLFKNAYDDHWKEIEGSIIAFINPGVLPARDQKAISLRANFSNTIVKIGEATDFGICKALTRNGKRCNVAINSSKCRYCLYHITTKFKQAGTHRMELNGAYTYNKHVLKGKENNLSKGTYGRNGFTPIQKKQSDVTMGVNTRITTTGTVVPSGPKAQPLQPYSKRSSLEQIQNKFNQAKQSGEKMTQSQQMVYRSLGVKLPNPRKRSLNSHLESINQDTDKKRDVLGEALKKSKSGTLNKAALSSNRVELPKESFIFSKSSRAIPKPVPINPVTPIATINNKCTKPSTMKTQHSRIAAKLHAEGVALDRVKHFKSAKLKSLNNSMRSMQKASPGSAFVKVFGKQPLTADIINQKSSHAHVLEDQDDQRLDSKLYCLEAQEHFDSEKQQQTSIQLNAYCCSTCQYTLEKPLEKCGEMGHDVAQVKVTKRWFECRNCKHRCSLLNARIPTRECEKCHQMDWIPCSMYRKKKGPDTQPKFLPTGGKEVNSLRYG